MIGKRNAVLTVLGVLIVLSIAYLFIPSQTSVLLSPGENGDLKYANYAVWFSGILVLIILISFIGVLSYSLVRIYRYRKKH